MSDKKRNIWLVSGGGVVVLLILFVLFSADSAESSATSPQQDYGQASARESLEAPATPRREARGQSAPAPSRLQGAAETEQQMAADEPEPKETPSRRRDRRVPSSTAGQPQFEEDEKGAQKKEPIKSRI